MEGTQTDAHDTTTTTAASLHHRSASISSGSGSTSSSSRQSKRTLSNAAQHHSHSHSCSSPCHPSSPAPHYSDHSLSPSHVHQHHGSQQHCPFNAHNLQACSLTATRPIDAEMSGSELAPSSLSSLHSADAISPEAGLASPARRSSKGAVPLSPDTLSPSVRPQNSEAADDSGADGSTFPALSSGLALRRTSGSQDSDLRRSDCTSDVDGLNHLQSLATSRSRDKDLGCRLQNYNTICSPPLSAVAGHQSSVPYEIEQQNAGGSCITSGEQHFALQQLDQSDSAGCGEWPEVQLEEQRISAHESGSISGRNGQLRRSIESTPQARSQALSPPRAMVSNTPSCSSRSQALSQSSSLSILAKPLQSHLARSGHMNRKSSSKVQSKRQAARDQIDSVTTTIGRGPSSNEVTLLDELQPAGSRAEPAQLVLREEERRRKVGDSTVGHASTSTHQRDFYLQPVPQSKRRRLQAEVSNAEVEPCTSTTTLVQPHASAGTAALSDDAVSVAAVDSCTAAPSGAAMQRCPRTEEADITPRDQNTDAECVTAEHDGTWKSHRDPLAELFPTPRGVLLESKPVTDHQTSSLAESTSSLSNRQRGRERHAEETVVSRAHAAPRLPASGRSRRGQLTRSLSLPNLRVKQDLNPSSRAKHRLINPYRPSRPSDKALHKQQHKYARYLNHPSTIARAAICTPPMVPPITRATLLELDLHEIVKNPQLRHDIVFDAHVQFRPNFDGDRGKKKREACERYWTAIAREVETGCVCTAFDDNRVLACTCSASARKTHRDAGQIGHGRARLGRGTLQPHSVSHPSRLSTLILELRAICLSVLPNPVPSSGEALVAMAASSSSFVSNGIVSLPSGPGRAVRVPTTFFSGPAAESSSHHTHLAEILDPTLISQQLAYGVLDISSLVQSVASILALHCAPPRKELIQQMVNLTQSGDVGQGLRMCFEILELMKLDIANHQLRSTRPWLVHTAVEFEARWFRDQISSGKLGRLDKTVNWLHRSWTDATGCELPRVLCRPAILLKVFNAGFMQLVFDPPSSPALDKTHASARGPTTASIPVPGTSPSFNHSASFPETFQFDAFRMTTFHNEIIDMSIVYMLLLLFRQLACSPASATPSTSAGRWTAQVATAAAGLSQRCAEAMKSEIWCLLNEANAKLPAGSRSPTLASSGNVTEQWAGVGKLGNPTWLSAVKSVLIQVAARAGAVWDDAFKAVCRNPRPATAAEPGAVETLPPVTRVPNFKTMTLLDSWISNQLSRDSPLMRLCIGKMKTVLECDVSEKVASEAKQASSTLAIHCVPPLPGPRCSRLARSTACSAAMVAERKRTATDSSEDAAADSNGKRRKGEGETAVKSQDMEDVEDGRMESHPAVSQQASSCASIAELNDRIIRPRASPRRRRGSSLTMQHDVTTQECCGMPAEALSGDRKGCTALTSQPEDWDALVTRAGLGAMKGELRSLGVRLAQVATMNIKTFLPLYETILCCSEE